MYVCDFRRNLNASLKGEEFGGLEKSTEGEIEISPLQICKPNDSSALENQNSFGIFTH